MSESKPDFENHGEQNPRRRFLAISSNLAMGGGLLAGYGTFAVMAGQFLYAEGGVQDWQFVTTLDRMRPGEAYAYTAPTGYSIVIARHGEGETEEDFVALSSVCPHLGCQVHWESQNNRFFCPCHNGVFDPQGTAVSGPPAKGKQNLVRYHLRVEEGKLFILVPLAESSTAQGVAQVPLNNTPSTSSARKVAHG